MKRSRASLRVGIDITDMNPLSKSRGIGFYTSHLFNALKKYTDVEISLIENGDYSNFDLIHLPFFDPFFNTLKIKSIPTVVTVHDITPLIFPQHYPPGLRGRLNLFKQKKAIKKVDKVITDSEYSRKDITRVLNIPPEKITVIPLAPAEEFKIINDMGKLQAIKTRYSLPDKFVLYSGGVNWNKNLLSLAKVCSDTEVELVLVGQGFETINDLHHPELESFKEFMDLYSDNPKFHILGFIPLEDLVVLYNLAEVLIMPSFYEGFGLPILEAQISGIPVITSNVSSLPEVAGKGASLINPNNLEELKEALEKVLKDPKLKETLVKKGFENVKRYSWKKTAEETYELYKSMING